MKNQRETHALRLHPLHRTIPKADKKSPEWRALLSSVASGGILYPLLGTADGQIMDGAWRWEAAKTLDLPEVPYEVRDESDAATIIVESLLHRKQMTRGAAVYLALRLLPEFVQSSEHRRLANLRRGSKNREIPLKVPKRSNCASGENWADEDNDSNTEEFCLRWGVARRTIVQALQVTRYFEANPDQKAELEPQLLNGEKNLWNVLSYVGGAEADQSERGFKLLVSSFNNLRLGAGTWNDLTRSEREKLLATWEKTSAEFPATMRTALINVLTAKEAV
jgi:hypothetical protein